MNKDYKNLLDIYSKEKAELKAALMEKANWINHKFYIEGNINKIIKNDGLEHYPFLEALYGGNLLFNSATVDESIFKSEEVLYIKHEAMDLRELVLDNDINFNKSDFVIEVDFNKLELSNYYNLFPNFYHMLDKKDVDIDLTKTDFVEIIKCLILGKTSQNKIILDKIALVNDMLYAPILSKIYYKESINKDLLESLNEIGKKFNIEVVMYEKHNL